MLCNEDMKQWLRESRLRAVYQEDGKRVLMQRVVSKIE